MTFSLEVQKGEIVTILGSSGSGKTTIFNIIAGLTSIDQGAVEVNGTLGYMQQKDLLLPWKTIHDNVSLPLRLKGVKKELIEEKIKVYLPLVGLAGFEDKYPHQLSGGDEAKGQFSQDLDDGGGYFSP